MPCLNESETVGLCVRKAVGFLKRKNINGEVIVADNGSTDGSPDIARANGARVVNVPEKGYGSALIGGISAAESKYVIMGDSDDSHDLENLDEFVEKLEEGYELVVGNRFRGGIEPGAMSFAHRYIGNPILSGIGRIFFHSKVKDFHCGLRGFRKELFNRLDLRATGMEFASEMIVKASLFKVNMVEVPTKMAPAGRTGPAHLRSFRDGWRHLRFLFMFSPKWLFLYPGLTLILLGLVIGLWLLPGTKMSLDVHTMLYASAAVSIGFQSVSFALLTRIFALHEQLMPAHPTLQRLIKFLTLEKGLIAGSLMILTGLGVSIYLLIFASEGRFPELGIQNTMRLVIPAITLLILGFQVIYFSFFLSILQLKTR